MNRESNKFILIFASIMVVIVALVLSLAHEALKDTQNSNVEIDKKLQILRSININATNKEAEAEYDKLITDVFAVDIDGNKTAALPAEVFDIDMKEELAKPVQDRQYPVYAATIDNETKYIMALAGKGLWGDIWGYVSVNADGNTIYGADFGHAGETPGLGAEIATPAFSGQFAGKHLYQDGKFLSVAVVKKGKTDAERDYVDGISGGTLTGKGLDKMLFDSLEGYDNFLKKLKQ
ncbi:MAG: NADH:ubiquinone reductase (Na(+)-transporting) subunit C [Prevotella sp.]|jgi:Na+-transporting NADH:ubiquinone oxidoreductase subunit C|nr:NADH:ubiquinone reductase (Na(+)-transporting) subunit C [Prevotella sp.]